MALRYDDTWLASPSARPLSLSLPLPLTGNAPLRGDRVEYFFDNLLPDSGTIRRRLAQRHAAGSEDTFDLLAAIGRDCVGAVQFLPADAPPAGFDRIEGEPLDEEAVAALLRATVASGAWAPHQGKETEFRVSIAGAQEKTALLLHAGTWLRPLGATPSTHILKLPLGQVGNMQADMRTSVYNEWLCLKFMDALGLDVAQADIVTFADHPPVLVVDQYRVRRRSRIFGRHSRPGPGRSPPAAGEESMCPRSAACGRSVRLAQVISGSQNTRADLRTLLASQVVFWLLAATDGHAKNFSIRLQAGGAYVLAPLYDVLSAWPVIGSGKNQLAWRDARLAMAVSGKNRHYALATIMRRHFNATAARCGWGANAEDIVEELLARVEPAIAAVTRLMPAGFPHDVAEAIFGGVRQQVRRLQAQPGL